MNSGKEGWKWEWGGGRFSRPAEELKWGENYSRIVDSTRSVDFPSVHTAEFSSQNLRGFSSFCLHLSTFLNYIKRAFLSFGWGACGDSGLWNQNNDWYRRYRRPTELVQHSAYRRSSRRCKGAASYIIDMVCLFVYCSPIQVWRKGIFHLFIWRLPAFAAPRGRGGGSQHPVLTPHSGLGRYCSPLMWSIQSGEVCCTRNSYSPLQ